MSEILPIKESLAIKKLGFKGKCYDVHKVYEKHAPANVYTTVPAPLLQQAFDFFLSEYNLHVEYVFDDMTWTARIGEFTIPDFCPDEQISLEESSSFESAKKDYYKIKTKALGKLIEIVNKNIL